MSASYFPYAHNFHVEGGTYITATNFSNHSAPQVTPFDLLCNNIAEEAMHNSGERYDAPKVHPETRKAVQEEIFGWIKHGDEDAEPKKILWVSGPAGAGKSAIAGSIAELCDEEGLLAGSFFFSSFSGSQKRRLKKYVVATLAYCLLQHDSMQDLRRHILSMIERDPTIFQKTLRDQCKAFLLRPFWDAPDRLDFSTLPKVIILDGLDEVEADDSRRLNSDESEARLANEVDQVEILTMLLRAAQDPRFPFRIVVFSRPERVISNFFGVSANHISRQIFLDDKYDPDSDIELFLRAKFAAIRRRYKLAEEWPSEDQIGQLVANASGQFIYSATVIRFLESGKRPDPQRILRIILESISPQQPLDALAPLDTLYTRILMSSPDPPLAIRWICMAGSHSFLPTTAQPTAKFVRQLYQDFDGQEGYLLENLASLVSVPCPNSGQDYGYEFYHKSMLDFLRSAQRCGSLLNDSYKAGFTFFRERWYAVLQAQSTVVPLIGSEWGDFLCDFWDLCEVAYKEATFSQRGVLSSCDIAGWVRMVDAVCAGGGKAGIVAHIFRSVHDLECFDSLTRRFAACSGVCRDWRSAILGECTRLGWDTPTHTSLLLERMYDHERFEDPRYEGDLLELLGCRHFQSPRSHPPLVVPPSGSGVTTGVVHTLADLQAYEALLAMIQTIYQALPTDWLDRYHESLQDLDVSYQYAAVLQLRRIRQEVRSQMTGLDAWLNTDWSEEDGDSEEINEGEVSERNQGWQDRNHNEEVESIRTEHCLPQPETSGSSSEGGEPDAQAIGGSSRWSLTTFEGIRAGSGFDIVPSQEPFLGHILPAEAHLFPQPFPSPILAFEYDARSWNGSSTHTGCDTVTTLTAPSNVWFPTSIPTVQYPSYLASPPTYLEFGKSESPYPEPDEGPSWVETVAFPFHLY